MEQQTPDSVTSASALAHDPGQGWAAVAPTSGPAAVMGWALYLGFSWTWVIGMLLPILLLADFGVWGFIAFAIPNVLGAAAMGFVLRDADVSARLTRDHAAAIRVFSVVTIAYQLTVLLWFWSIALPPVAMTLLAVIACALMLAPLTTTTRLMALTLLTGGVSLLALVMAATQPQFFAGLAMDPETSRLGGAALLWFVPASLLGFVFCPYLDRTFHHARQHTDPATGRWAFAVGFGAVFALMILFSLGYAALLRPLFFDPDGKAVAVSLPLIWLVLLTVHLSIQGLYTASVHTGGNWSNLPRLDRVGVLALTLLGLLGWRYLQSSGTLGEMPAFQAVYRLFLLCYGLPFPAYVWLCMLPLCRPLAGRIKVIVTMLAIAAAAWPACAAALGGQWSMVAWVVAILVAARLILEGLALAKALKAS